MTEMVQLLGPPSLAFVKDGIQSIHYFSHERILQDGQRHTKYETPRKLARVFESLLFGPR